jgi:hypothetical protein
MDPPGKEFLMSQVPINHPITPPPFSTIPIQLSLYETNKIGGQPLCPGATQGIAHLLFQIPNEKIQISSLLLLRVLIEN